MIPHDPENPMTLFLLGQNDPYAKHHIELWLGLRNQAANVADISSSNVDGSREDEVITSSLGEPVTIKLTGPVFNKNSHIKLWWVEGRPVSGVIEVGQWPQDPRPVYCTAYVSRRGEAYSRIPFMLGLETQEDGRKTVVVNEIGQPFWPRALHRDSDVPCTQRYDDEPMRKWETVPKGRYAVLIASDGDTESIKNRGEKGRVSDARQLERVLRAHGYSIARFYGSRVDASVVQHALQHCLRPPEPPRQMGRGGWWAGGSRSAEVLAFISVPFSIEFVQLRTDLMVGGRCARPFYLQGYNQHVLNRRDMLTSRILLVVDNQISPSDVDFVKGSCTDIQLGTKNLVHEGHRAAYVPMQCDQNVAVQCLSMPYYPTDDNGSICSMFVRCLCEGMSGSAFRNMTSSDYLTTSALCCEIEKYTRVYVRDSDGNGDGNGYLRETCAPSLLHVYPGPVVHPDAGNPANQLWFRRTQKQQRKVLKERQKIREQVQERQKETARKKRENYSMSMHAIMLKSKITAIKREMKMEQVMRVQSSSSKGGKKSRRSGSKRRLVVDRKSASTMRIYSKSGESSISSLLERTPSPSYEDDDGYSSLDE
jgi:hypothetical protein